MTNSTLRLKQLAEKLVLYEQSPLVHSLDRSDFKLAANPEAVLGLITRIEKLEAALVKISESQFWAEAAVIAREALKEET